MASARSPTDRIEVQQRPDGEEPAKHRGGYPGRAGSGLGVGLVVRRIQRPRFPAARYRFDLVPDQPVELLGTDALLPVDLDDLIPDLAADASSGGQPIRPVRLMRHPHREVVGEPVVHSCREAAGRGLDASRCVPDPVPARSITYLCVVS